MPPETCPTGVSWAPLGVWVDVAPETNGAASIGAAVRGQPVDRVAAVGRHGKARRAAAELGRRSAAGHERDLGVEEPRRGATGEQDAVLPGHGIPDLPQGGRADAHTGGRHERAALQVVDPGCGPLAEVVERSRRRRRFVVAVPAQRQAGGETACGNDRCGGHECHSTATAVLHHPRASDDVRHGCGRVVGGLGDLGEGPGEQVLSGHHPASSPVISGWSGKAARSAAIARLLCALHGADGDAHEVGDLGLGQLLVEPQHDHGALLGREPAHEAPRPRRGSRRTPGLREPVGPAPPRRPARRPASGAATRCGTR